MSEEIASTLEERKAEILIKLRGYKLLGKKEYKNATGLFIKTKKGKKDKAMIYCIPSQGTVGVQYINQLAKIMKEEELERSLVVTSGRYTQAAKVNARKKGIELIPRIFPVFNIFDHEIVPLHEVLPPEEREKLLTQYRVRSFQLPKVKTSDPVVKAIGAKAGDIVKITRDSETAGEYVAYRYVVEG
ncbi:MAG: DNA-directed RNA polymerase subunit H [Candidatus Bathyarchaeia archaeon]